MKQLTRIPRFSLSLLCILGIAFFFRVVLLDRITPAISNDELDYILTAKALFLTGSDIGGFWRPWTLVPPQSSFPQAEIPAILMSPVIGMFPLSLLFSRLPYALVSVLAVGMIYGITQKLVGKKEAIFAGLAAAVNPWLIFFGRTGYDTAVSITFLLVAWYVLLSVTGWRILFAFIPLAIAFYSYIGMKLLVLPVAGCFVAFSWFANQRKFTTQYLVLLGLCVLLTVSFILRVEQSTGTRVSELATPWMPEIADLTNNERRLSIQSPLTVALSNKYIVFTKYLVEKYLGAFSPNFLFLHGDAKPQFSVYYHGVFYVVDSLFVLLGYCVLFARNKRLWLFLTSLILLAPLPSVLSTVGVSYAIRSMLLAPLFLLLIGIGVDAVFLRTSRMRFGYMLLALIGGMYIVQIINFSNIYFLRNPIYNSESFTLSGRILSSYLSRVENSETDIYVINEDPTTPLKQYIFYANRYTASTAQTIRKLYQTKQYHYQNFRFVACPKTQLPPNTTTLAEAGTTCRTLPKASTVRIAQLSDGGGVVTIANDTLCRKYSLRAYPSDISLDDFAIEKLSTKDFCETFITR